jgi:hypothetical protein
MSGPLLSLRTGVEPKPDAEEPRANGAALTVVPPPAAHTADALPLNQFASESDPLSAFNTENEIRYKTQRRPVTKGPGALVVTIAVAVLTGILMAAYMAVRWPHSSSSAAGAAAAAPVATGQAQFDSRPSGADVLVDGIVRGRTPLKLSLPVGAHQLEIRSDAGTRTLPLAIEAGVLVQQYVELASAADSTVGRLDISSDPPGAQVRVDGVSRGVTPLTLSGVEAREHSVSLSRGTTTVLRTVRVTPGATASVVVSMGSAAAATPGAVGGFIELRTPFEMQVFEDGRLLGTTSTDRLMVPTGRHELELVSAPFQFRTSVAVTVEPGKVAAPAVSVPNGSLSVNALPWADVFVDGRPVGTTPLANLTVLVGNHEVIWRHPQLGERRQTVAVTAQTPVRVGVNFAQ